MASLPGTRYVLRGTPTSVSPCSSPKAKPTTQARPPCRPVHASAAATDASPTAQPQQSLVTPSAAPQLAKWSGSGPHSAGLAVISASGTDKDGLPKPNQDAFTVQQVSVGAASATLLGVFDGHGTHGTAAAEAVARHAASAAQECAREALAAAPGECSLWWDPDCVTNLAAPSALDAAAVEDNPFLFTLDSAQSCLQETFTRVADQLSSLEDCDLSRSGCTAALCLLLEDLVVAAWAGDSRAVIGTLEGSSFTAVQLTHDHKPEKFSELSRIVAAGGKVVRAKDKAGNPAGPFRLCLPGLPLPGLSVARGFGDTVFSRIGLTAAPDVAVFSRSPGDILIVATDGLFDMVPNQEAVEIAAAAGSAEEAAKQLLATARRRWAYRTRGKRADDVTVAVAYL